MNIALIGYGKMGQMIEKLAIQRGHNIVCIIDIDNQDDFDSAAFQSADVAIEFTTPFTAYNNIKKCFDRDIKVVTGSTGWQKDHWQEINDMCKYGLHTLFWSSNFSLGVYLFNKLNKQLAKLMAPYSNYEPYVEEIHHVHKLDAPSGTAMMIASAIDQEISDNVEYVYDRHSVNKARSKNEIGISSIRGGNIVGEHEVYFVSDEETIKITHQCMTREAFARGALAAAAYIKDKGPGRYSMKDVVSEVFN